jgi:acetolactate synthase small subunit
MHAFHICYRNTQGTLMRILNAVSRRGIDLPYVQAEPAEPGHRVTLLLEANPKQIGQLYRDWQAVVDVVEVRAGAWSTEIMDFSAAWATTPHPPASAEVPGSQASRAARA